MKINAAIIGTGIGIKHLEAIQGYRGSEVLIICEKNKKKIINLKKKYPDIEITSNEKKIFSDNRINLVSIASFDNYHFSQILKCFNSNKNIIVEKPMCLSEVELKKIISLTKIKKNIKITSNLVLRVNSLFKHIRKKICKKDIYYIEADYIWGRPEKLLQWRSKIKNYSITLGAGIHMIDLVMWMLKSKPISVHAYGNNIATKKTLFSKKSFILYVFHFPNNILVKITSNAPSLYEHFHEVKIFEKKKTFVHSFSGTYFFEKKNKKTNLTKISSNYPDKSNRKKLIQNFIDSIQNKNIKPLITIKEQIDLMTVCFASDKSLKLGRAIKIKYL